ncbi:DUF7475 family protein [Salinilacihabitans rarus]|uniref:DUF7475 family protein n=1 Tax=Salinilacihabitans rarus TaxID=2961596 RepID=UPI0020C90828|nr:hypothetical protein [Salinilacihabitans rarus]
MDTSAGRLALGSLGPLHWLAIALAVVTGVVHLVLGVDFLPHPMGAAFLIAAVGFFGGVALVLVGYRRRLLYLLGVPFTAGQVVLWYLLNRPAGVADLSGAEAVDKVAQLLLIAALTVLYARDR